MTNQVASALQRLLGARLVATGRAADLQWFTFRREDAPDLSLHIMCPWRITSHSAIAVAHSDYWRPAADDTPTDEYERGDVGARLRDVYTIAFRDRIPADGLAVLRVTPDLYGGFSIELSDETGLDAFPDASKADHDDVEFWRVFEKGQDHFVFTSDGSYVSGAESPANEA